MSHILCIETATEVCSVSVAVNGKTATLLELNEGYTHASRLPDLIQNAITQAGIKLSDLNAVAVSKGPGSYTGLRVGVSTAKGLCYALDIPLLSVNTLHALAWCARQTLNTNEYDLLIPMIDARRMEVYCAVYDKTLNELLPAEARIIEAGSFSEFNHHRIVFFGNGASKCSTVLQQPHALFLPNITCSALGMAQLAQQVFEQQHFEDVAYFEPYYLKDFVGTTPKPKWQ
ncbi:MAG: tRNA (adenosine(37)-N6)-threonylcarbamoyltransferase complex dimerization subunit type 1 TsaB [Bacteroidota bacterium]|jgi:tRNA threonylcarbamoyladenosine biosynthesis protein TsaB